MPTQRVYQRATSLTALETIITINAIIRRAACLAMTTATADGCHRRSQQSRRRIRYREISRRMYARAQAIAEVDAAAGTSQAMLHNLIDRRLRILSASASASAGEARDIVHAGAAAMLAAAGHIAD